MCSNSFCHPELLVIILQDLLATFTRSAIRMFSAPVYPRGLSSLPFNPYVSTGSYLPLANSFFEIVSDLSSTDYLPLLHIESIHLNPNLRSAYSFF